MEYVRFDVDKIKDYVFESFKPKEVKGASEMIKKLDGKGEILKTLIHEFKKDTKIKPRFARGGGGLLEIEGPRGKGKLICQWLENNYSNYVPGGKLTAVFSNEEMDFPNTLSVLNYKLRDRKNEKILAEKSMSSVEFTKQNPRCRSCGKRKSEGKPVKIEDEQLPYCPVCKKKREYGEKKGVDTFKKLLEVDNPNVKDSKHVLMIYGDLNEAGVHFSSMSNPDELSAFSEAVFKTLSKIRKDIEEDLTKQGFKVLAPVVGGDDMIILTHPAALCLIKDKLKTIEEGLKDATGKKLKMNFSFIMVKHNFPIYQLFKISDDLLKMTKDAFYKVNEKEERKTHHGFFWLWEGDYRPAKEDVYLKTDFFTLFDVAKAMFDDSNIHKSVMYNVLEFLLPENSEESRLEAQLNLEYFLARNNVFQDYLELKGGELWLKEKKTLKLRVTRDVWEDLLSMEDLFFEQDGKGKEGK
jgi:hypothetical protein